MRALFADGWNSFWHVAFGMIGSIYPIVLALFIGYQLIDPYEMNVWIDISEGLIGYSIMQNSSLSKA
uniref:Uncharacterized protein n=1 Tax=viral metagenome TaxID=1070528 RepID=A0A6C0JLH3_9ZZZZ